MANFVFANNIKTTVASAFSNVATSLTLASSTGLPALSAGQVLPITLNDAATGLVYEICYATAITGATLTVTRAQEGTAAQNWSVGDRAYCAPTALSVAPVNGNGLNVFQVANAVSSNEAVPLAQAETLSTSGNAATANTLNSGLITIASATTPDIFAAAGNTIDYTGTVTTTGFAAAPKAGMTRRLICAGDAPFTAGANLLIEGIPSGTTITLAANAIVDVTAITTTQFKMTYSVSGTFTGTYTGFTTVVTGAVNYTFANGVIVFNVFNTGGTSNATTFTITGGPVFSDVSLIYSGMLNGLDNTTRINIIAGLNNTGVIAFQKFDGSLFTTSGNKGLVTNTIVFHI